MHLQVPPDTHEGNHMTHPVREDFAITTAERWLSGLDRYSLARQAWGTGGVASIEAVAFDAIQLNAAAVSAGIQGIKDSGAIEAHFKAAGITTAVIVTRSRTLYTVLVPQGSTLNWDEPNAACIGMGHAATYVAVPRTHRMSPPGAHWLLPAPDGPDDLPHPNAVRLLFGSEAKDQKR